MQHCNVLILSAGRRVELVKCFKKASSKLGLDSLLVAGDCQENAPALYFADDRVILPRISSPKYIDSIIDVCNRYEISLVVPTIDTDLLVLAINKERIEGATSAKVLISNKEVVQICRDKIKTQRFLKQSGFVVPHMYSAEKLVPQDLEFPMFIKPRDGSSSINAFKVNNKKELDAYLHLIKNPIIQAFASGDEYTIDSFLDFKGNVISIVPRLRIATRGGEVSKGKIVKEREIISDVKRMLHILKPIGPITIQCIKTQEDIKYIEINPRFGGGVPMSIYSGADSCEALYRLLAGESLQYHENYRDGLLFLRFDDTICIDEKRNKTPTIGVCND